MRTALPEPAEDHATVLNVLGQEVEALVVLLTKSVHNVVTTRETILMIAGVMNMCPVVVLIFLLTPVPADAARLICAEIRFSGTPLNWVSHRGGDGFIMDSGREKPEVVWEYVGKFVWTEGDGLQIRPDSSGQADRIVFKGDVELRVWYGGRAIVKDLVLIRCGFRDWRIEPRELHRLKKVRVLKSYPQK
jgi:hypothetical protein